MSRYTFCFSLVCCASISLLSIGCGSGSGTDISTSKSGRQANQGESTSDILSSSSNYGTHTGNLDSHHNHEHHTLGRNSKTEVKTVSVSTERQVNNYLTEIQQIRSQPFPKTQDLEILKNTRRERNLHIIEVANKAIGLTHKDSSLEAFFNQAVASLMEAHLQLALQGATEDIDAIYGAAAALYERDPNSEAAAEAGYALARLAHTNARRYAPKEPRWLVEFARQARLFAENFPQQAARSVPLLYAAAWSCELHQMRDEAIACYTLLQEKFPKTHQGAQSEAVLRRLMLIGQTPDLQGPTLDGGFVSLDDQERNGKVVLVVFWSSDTARFAEELPYIQKIVQKHGTAGLKVVGVNLDEEELDVDRFLQQHAMPWPHIFYPGSDQRRWENPIAKFYGIRDIPMYWLIDRQGRVVDNYAQLKTMDKKIQQLLLE